VQKDMQRKQLSCSRREAEKTKWKVKAIEKWNKLYNARQ
jgi:hypothetical protein